MTLKELLLEIENNAENLWDYHDVDGDDVLEPPSVEEVKSFLRQSNSEILSFIKKWAESGNRKCDHWSGCGLSEFSHSDSSCGSPPFFHQTIEAYNQALADLINLLENK